VATLSELKAAFCEIYPGAGEPGICRAPGRVNIIGEHTDYNGLPVLPMTIGQDIRIAFASRRDGAIRLHNTDRRFSPAEFANGRAIPPSATGAWDNYCKAAVQALNEHLEVTRFPGMDLLVSGDIPVSAGLSSSSALVVACALAYLRALGKTLGEDIARLALAELMAEAEHYVGTRGGGMDQAVILLGQEGRACKIDFFPLRIENAALLDSHRFVVCHSGVKAAKTGEMLHRYNAGPRLSQLICALVGKRLREEFDEEVAIARLGDLWYGHLCLTHREVGDLFARTFPTETLRLAEAAIQLGLTPEAIRERWLGDLKEPEGGFHLQARARHQLTEHRRVEEARDALLAGDAAGLGALMNDSHASCAKDYRISCPELETLVAIGRDCGAAGARLTGAGFGGCTVNLVSADATEDFEARVRRDYHEQYLASRGIAGAGEQTFVARSSAGAGYL